MTTCLCKHQLTLIFFFCSKNFNEPRESFIHLISSFCTDRMCVCTVTASPESSCFSFDLSRFSKLSGFSCPSVTSALVVQQLQISHHYTREIRGSPPPPDRFIELALNVGLLLVELSPSCSRGRFQLVWALICCRLLPSTPQTYLHDLLDWISLQSYYFYKYMCHHTATKYDT